MNNRDFFEQEYCERCHSELMVRTTSWFTTETICGDCSMWEEAIIRAQDESKSSLEGCDTFRQLSLLFRGVRAFRLRCGSSSGRVGVCIFSGALC